MICLQVRFIGFSKDLGDKVYNLCIDVDEKISNILEYLKKNFNIVFNLDEVMVLCNDRQVYIDESVPKDCDTLTIFPLALGGLR